MASEYPATRFGLLRHAETVWNSEKRIQGHSDSPLTPSGRQHAEQWGLQLGHYAWDRVLVSDLGRARETAGCVNISLKLPIHTDPGIREQNWGLWEGKKIHRLRDQALMGEQVAAGWSFCPPEGEDRESVWKRGHDAICRAADRWPGNTILIVTHEGMLKCLIYRLLGRQFLPSEPKVMKSACLHFFRYDQKGLSIEQINALPLR
jgi:broad specificity phosphatase PhoE